MNSEPNQPFDAATTVEHSSGGPEGPRPLLLARSMRDEIVSHLRGALPNEGCGLIASVRRDDLDLAIQFFPGANIDRSPVRYTMDPKEVIDAMREMRTHEWQLAAIVHSHPRTPAAPSRTDLAEAYYPDARLLIVSFAASEPELACWALMRERGAPSFRSARLQIEERWTNACAKAFLYAWSTAFAGLRAADERCRAGNRWRSCRQFRKRMEPPRRSREQILEELAGFPEDLRRLLFSAHDDDALYRPGSDGGWGVVEILPHLRDWEEIYLQRARQIVEVDEPDIPGYDDALWPIERDYRGQDPRDVFDDFAELRREHVDYLLGLDPAAWGRTGIHSLYGKITLGWMEDHVCDHDSEHLEQARDVLAG